MIEIVDVSLSHRRTKCARPLASIFKLSHSEVVGLWKSEPDKKLDEAEMRLTPHLYMHMQDASNPAPGCFTGRHCDRIRKESSSLVFP